MGPFCLEHEVTEAHLHDGKDLFSESYFFFPTHLLFLSPCFLPLKIFKFPEKHYYYKMLGEGGQDF